MTTATKNSTNSTTTSTRINPEYVRKLLREGAVFYAPNARPMRAFKEIVQAWIIFRRLCFRRPGSAKLWEIHPDGSVVEQL